MPNFFLSAGHDLFQLKQPSNLRADKIDVFPQGVNLVIECQRHIHFAHGGLNPVESRMVVRDLLCLADVLIPQTQDISAPHTNGRTSNDFATYRARARS